MNSFAHGMALTESVPLFGFLCTTLCGVVPDGSSASASVSASVGSSGGGVFDGFSTTGDALTTIGGGGGVVVVAFACLCRRCSTIPVPAPAATSSMTATSHHGFL